jgi:peptidoglycan/LPS O-acetylase OafA/YrhL
MSSEKNISHKFYFPNLDALRYIAFLFVFFAHSFQKSFEQLQINNYFIKKIIHFFFYNGGMGVSIFFVLSGFLITYNILYEINDTGKLSLKNFFIKRTFRIWPLYYLLVIWGFIIYPFIKVYIFHLDYYTCATPIYYYTFLGNLDSIFVVKNCMANAVSFQGITWSVAIEEQFYLAWPLLFFFLPVRYYKQIIYATLCICIAFRLININDYYILYYHTVSVMGDLALGALVAYYAIYNKSFIAVLNKLNTTHIYIIYIIGLIILIMLHDETYPMSPIVNRLYSTLYFAFVIAAQNFHLNNPLPLSRLGLFSRWGKYTYGLYLFHLVVYYFCDLFLKRLTLNISPVIYHLILSCVTYLGSMLFCYFLYHYFELYFLRLRNKLITS